MTARDLVDRCAAAGPRWQLAVSGFVDEFRDALPAAQEAMVADGPERSGRFEGLVAAVVSALCREAGIAAPPWVARTCSPEPFFALAARGYALRVRLMLESPPPFRVRNVFVPASYLDRA